ncbi:MAG: response regulator [Candidatus Aminicenantales bacterium]
MLKSKPILIVDDEKNIRLTMSQALESLGVGIETAVNGEEALSKLQEKDFGLIILDLKLPGIEGMEVLRRLEEIRPDVKVIIVTAYGTIDSAVEAMKLGAADYVQKPFAPAEIRELVSRVIDRELLDEKKAADYATFIELSKKRINERQFDAAVEFVKRAIALDPTRPEAFNILGVLMEVRQDHIEAREQYRAALSLDPTYEPARKNLDRLAFRRREEKISIGEAPKNDLKKE